jgi:lambda repressor-like predicted transcriptional regulator
MARNKRVLSDDFRAWKGEATKLKVQRGWTNRDLALRAGLSLSQVNNYMAGSYPNDYPREPIERALGMR